MTTFTLSRSQTTAASATVKAIFGMALLRVWSVLRALKHRHDAVMLAGFDDRMLADIGLSRSDVRDAYSVPLWRDPTALLKNRVGERHRYRHGAPFGLSGQSVASPSLVPANGFTVPPTDRPARQTV